MDSKIAGPSLFTLGVAVRAVIIGTLAFVAAYLVASTQLYVTALVVAMLAIAVGVDMARVIIRTDRLLERFLEGLAAGTSEMPLAKGIGLARVSHAIRRTAQTLNAARDERQRQIEHLQSLIDTVSAALMIVDEKGEVVFVNRAACELARVPAPRLNDIPVFHRETAEILANLAPGTRRIVSLQDGRQMLAAAAQFRTPNGKPQRLVSLQRITGELDIVELKAWQDVARVLAHEMMNSLTPIASLSENLETLLKQPGEMQGDMAGAVEAIKRRSTGLMSFIERYRKVAELPQPAAQVLKAEAFVAGIERLMRATFLEKGISFGVQVAPKDLTLYADPELLEQAVINLLRNAADAVKDCDAPAIFLRCETSADQIVIAVSDNGRGLPEGALDDVFLPFFTTKPDGSGIGLSLARQVAIAHGGRAEVFHNTPQGAVFRLVLPG